LIKVKGEIINGKENGIWEYFLKGKNEELLLIAKISFCNGVLDGSYIIYYSTGKIQILGKNCLGIPCGKWLYFDN
jgi:antitoxin component YwqK of YwqJK toxin-antitoxin module